MASTLPSLVLAAPPVSPDCAARAAAIASWGSGFPRLGRRCRLGRSTSNDCDTLAVEMAGETGAVAAGAFDTDELQRAEPTQPGQRLAIALSGGLEALHAQQRAAFVERSNDVHVEVGVDTCGNAQCQGSHRHLFR